VLMATSNWESLTPDFPNMEQFARLIVRVNFKDGPVYADAAYTGAAFGELPWFEKGITGMVIKGSKLQQAVIPTGGPEDNLSSWKYDMKVGSNGKVEGDEEMDIKGVRAIDYRADYVRESPDKVQQTLNGYFGMGREDSVVSQLTHPDFQDPTQALAIKAHVMFSVGSEAGPGEILMNPWMQDLYSTSPFKSADRQSFIHFDTPEKHTTTSTWTLPPDIQVEKLPDAVNMHGDMADFSHTCTQTGATVICTRTFAIKKTSMMGDPSSYATLKRFFDEISKHDQEVLLLRKQ